MRLTSVTLALPLVFVTQTSAVRVDAVAAPTPFGAESSGGDVAIIVRTEVAQLLAVLDDRRVPGGRRVQAARDLGRLRAPEAIPVLIKHIYLLDPGQERETDFFLPTYGVCARVLESYGPDMYEPVVRAYLTSGRRSQNPFRHEQILLECVLKMISTTKSAAEAIRFVLEYGKAVTDRADQSQLFQLYRALEYRDYDPKKLLPTGWPKLGD